MDDHTISRFLAKIEVATGGCWEWVGNRNGSGYGMFCRDDRKKKMRAHRVAYEHWVGDIPLAMLDHLCRNRCCVNPDHLEPVTSAENTRRSSLIGRAWGDRNLAKTHCPQGHLYDEANTYRAARGDRQCRACRRLRVAS